MVTTSPPRSAVAAAADRHEPAAVGAVAAPIVLPAPPPEVAGAFRRLVRLGGRIGLRIPLVLPAAELSVLVLLGPRSFSWLCAIALYALLASSAGFYRSRLSVLFLDDVAGVVGRLLAAAAAVAAVEHALDVPLVEGWWARVFLAGGGMLLARLAVYVLVRELRRRRLVAHRVMIVGAGRVGRDIADALLEHPEYGLQPVAFYDPDPLVPAEGEPSRLPILVTGVPMHVAAERLGVRVMLLAFSATPAEELVRAVRASMALDAEIFYVPRLFDLNSLSVRDIDEVWGHPLVRLRRAPLRSAAWRVKRLLDITVAAVALAVLAPVIGLIALAVRMFIGTPVIFRQQRISADNREFTIVKFRTLPVAGDHETDRDWSAETRRPNRLGAILRASSLDELPQLWNVLRGDMSLVGPRPERDHFVRQFADALEFYDDRHRVPAGLTGLAQIHGLRGDTSIADRARFDNAYVERWTLSDDIKIMLRTPVAAIRSRGR